MQCIVIVMEESSRRLPKLSLETQNRMCGIFTDVAVWDTENETMRPEIDRARGRENRGKENGLTYKYAERKNEQNVRWAEPNQAMASQHFQVRRKQGILLVVRGKIYNVYFAISTIAKYYTINSKDTLGICFCNEIYFAHLSLLPPPPPPPSSSSPSTSYIRTQHTYREIFSMEIPTVVISRNIRNASTPIHRTDHSQKLNDLCKCTVLGHWPSQNI